MALLNQFSFVPRGKSRILVLVLLLVATFIFWSYTGTPGVPKEFDESNTPPDRKWQPPPQPPRNAETKAAAKPDTKISTPPGGGKPTRPILEGADPKLPTPSQPAAASTAPQDFPDLVARFEPPEIAPGRGAIPFGIPFTPKVNEYRSRPKDYKPPTAIIQIPSEVGKSGLPPLEELSNIQKSFWKAGSLTVNLTSVADTYLSLVPPKVSRTPVCIVSTWEGGFMPDYIRVFLHSIAKNDGFASVYFFAHTGIGGQIERNFPDPTSFQDSDSGGSNVQVFDLTLLDQSYRYRGFAGYVADILCPYFKVDLQSPECRAFEDRLRRYRGGGSGIMEQLRGMYPVLFSHWINSERCESWAYATPNVVFGDMGRWMDNDLVWSADVMTLHGGDYHRVFLRRDFVWHNLRNNPETVLSLWKLCSNYTSIETLMQVFANPDLYQVIPESCYSHGVFTRPQQRLKVLALPWKTYEWTTPKVIQLYDRHLSYCNSDRMTAEMCRGQLKMDRKKKRALLTSKPKASLPPEAVDVFAAANKASSILEKWELELQPEIECANWLAPTQQLCLGADFADMPHSAPHKFAYVQEIIVPGPRDVEDENNPPELRSVIYRYVRPRDWIDPNEKDGLGEAMAIALPRSWIQNHNWKTKVSVVVKNAAGKRKIVKKTIPSVSWEVDRLDKERGWPVRHQGPVEQLTGWYTVRNGSIVMSERLIMYHSLSGLW
ncbi:hypothetical protein BJ742DRAFT_494333 [Cladochytrium replicatum]|nr:hypothetical protein BJ742DRAFT_494333 [Cladochytrium replicatum]